MPVYCPIDNSVMEEERFEGTNLMFYSCKRCGVEINPREVIEGEKDRVAKEYIQSKLKDFLETEKKLEGLNSLVSIFHKSRFKNLVKNL